MKFIISVMFATVLHLPLVQAKASIDPTKAIQAAIDDPARPQEERDVDAQRKPGEMMKLARVKPGDKVIDYMPGRGYFTRIFSRIVGPKGKVITVVPKELEGMKYKPVEAAEATAKGYPNVSVFVTPLLMLHVYDVDLVWTSLNYHDFHNKSFGGADLKEFNKAVFKALKKNGRYVVVDHVGKPGMSAEEAENMHRIDPATVKAEVEAAGFKLETESKVLANPEDSHALPVFDPAIKGKTDQFVYVFVKGKK
jgi:predicted methyltransferase